MQKADFKLTGDEREKLGQGDNILAVNFTDEQKAKFKHDVIVVDECHEMDMDSHGCIQCLCIFKFKFDPNLYAFQYSSEESFYAEWGDDHIDEMRPVFVVKKFTKTVVDYKHADGEEIEI